MAEACGFESAAQYAGFSFRAAVARSELSEDQSLARNGAGILMISSEQPEIIRVCDRAYVMRGGHIAGELARGELTEANIVRLGMQ